MHYGRQCNHKNPYQNNSTFLLNAFEVISVHRFSVNLMKLFENSGTNLLKFAQILEKNT